VAANLPVSVPADTVVVATLNIRNRADRWSERSRLLLDQLDELRPDVIGLQETRPPHWQAAWICREANRRLPPGEPRYTVVSARKTGLRRFWEGIAVMTRLPVLGTDTLDLRGGSRVAQRVGLALPDGTRLDFYNTHLHHAAEDDALRLNQSRRIIEWMDAIGNLPRVLTGDFNSEPDSSAVRFITERLGSAYLDAHGVEPELTSPTPLNRTDAAHLATIDYIFISRQLVVHNAWLTFTAPDERDAHLYASDHFGIAARVSVRR